MLSDAEALCSRVAILAGGRLAAEGPLSELLAFRVRGWELVAGGLTAAALECVSQGGRVAQATPLGADRFALQLTLATPPEQIVSELVQHGAQIVSLNPIRDTLEDFFVRQVQGS